MESKHLRLPKLLLVSDATLSEHSPGINRTLLNLFYDWPPEQLMLYAPADALMSHPPSLRFANNSTSFSGNIVPTLKNRLGNCLNPLLGRINFEMLDYNNLGNIDKLLQFSADVVLICPDTVQCLIVSSRLCKIIDKPVIVYVMDDWRLMENEQWLSRSAKDVIREVLGRADAWLVVGKKLQEALSVHYDIEPARKMYAHNTVEIPDTERLNLRHPNIGKFKIIYAGSVWPMHFDAIKAVAEAVCLLRKEGKDIELILHTEEIFWQNYEEVWNRLGVIYGAYIPRDDLVFVLNQADLLLVASSFLAEYATLSRLSVQTKIIDYMASGRSIISCGPPESASHEFLRTWNCGLICETDEIKSIVQILLEQMENRENLVTLGQKSFEVFKTNFSKPVVTRELYAFITELSETSSYGSVS